MRDEYVLFLDESEIVRSNTFAIAGIALKKKEVCILEEKVEEIKKLIWDDEYIEKEQPVLHCAEFQNVFNHRKYDNNPWVSNEYSEFSKKTAEEIEKIYYQVYGKMSQLLKIAGATVFSCIVKEKQLRDLYYIDENHDGIHLIDDKYNIALQRIIENYTHYLSVNDGYGDVIYESRNSEGENSSKSPDIKLVNVYHKIQANNRGIVYTNGNEVQNRNRTIMTQSKKENLAGLQIADFVAYNIIRLENCTVDKQKTDFMKQIHRMSYNGGHSIETKDQRSFWGMSVLPSFLKMEELISSNKKLKNAVESLKKERKSLKKAIDADKKQISILESEVSYLRNENEQLKHNKIEIDIEEIN